MMNINVVGRAASPTVTSFAGTDNKVTNFGLAVNEKDRDGKQKTTWFSVEAWNASATNAAAFIKRGNLVAVSGRLSVEHYEDKKTKEMRTKLVIKMSSFQNCSPKSTDTDEEGDDTES